MNEFRGYRVVTTAAGKRDDSYSYATAPTPGSHSTYTLTKDASKVGSSGYAVTLVPANATDRQAYQHTPIHRSSFQGK